MGQPPKPNFVLRRYDRIGERSIAACAAAIALCLLALHAGSALFSGYLDPFVVTLLAAMLTLAFCRWRLSRARKFSESVFCVLTVFEAVVLFGLLWSYQFAHAHPPEGVLKSPSIVFLFVFIAIRAVRFHPVPTLVAGASVILGWASLVAILAQMPAVTITHSYKVYLQGYALLIGAEVEKLTAFAAVTAIIAYSVSLAGELVGKLSRERQQAVAMQLRAERADQAKSEFLANMSHELRTPLNAVNGFAEMISYEIHGPISKKIYVDYAGDIQRSGAHLLKIIDQILEYSEVPGSAETHEFESIEPEAFLHSCRDAMIRSVGPSAERIALGEVKAISAVYAHPERLSRAVICLLDNALKYSPDDEPILVSWCAKADEVSICVTDHGNGIPEEDLQLVVDPFASLGQPHLQSTGGIGLGLPLVARVARLHGGRLEVSSVDGGGTIAKIVLPSLVPPAALNGLTFSDAA